MVDAARYSLSDEEADGLLYNEEHYSDDKLPRWHYERLKTSKSLRVAAALFLVGLVLWLFSPSHTIKSALATPPSVTTTAASTPASAAATGASASLASESEDNGQSSASPEAADAGVPPGHDACVFAFCKTEQYVFEKVRSFTLRNLMEPTERGDLFRNSWVRLVPGAPDQKDDIIVEITFNGTDAALSQLLDIKTDDDFILFDFPTRQLEAADSRHFIETQTKIYFKAGLRLDHITIESTTLGINIPEPIDIWTDSANMTCTAGSLMVDPMIDARYAFVTMEAGTILGTFPLHEALAMESDAGRIETKIVPQDHAKKHGMHAARASLIVRSSAGDVDIRYKTKRGVPERDYTVQVQTDFGKISGDYLHGSYTILGTVMGDIDAQILPVSANQPSELITRTHAGRQQIVVLEPHDQTTDARLTRLESSHESKLGSLDITYPTAWEGTLEAVSKMGSVEIDGNVGGNAGNNGNISGGGSGNGASSSTSLQIISEQRNLLGVLVEAERGQGEGGTVCGTERGDVKFSVS